MENAVVSEVVVLFMAGAGGGGAPGCPPPPPTRAEAALAFNLSERTLARRLHALHTSYVALLDHARRDLALQLLSDTTRSLHDIAHSLGFAELSPFYRAFQRWTGHTPGQWRCQAHIEKLPEG